MKENCNNYEAIFDIDNKKNLINQLTEKMSAADFWKKDGEQAKTISQLKILKDTVDPWFETYSKYKELFEIIEILNEDKDKDLVAGVDREVGLLIKKLDSLEFKTLLSGEFDANSAILSINSGAGGTESCDWAQMLFRMYARFAEIKGYKYKTIDVVFGEEAGIKSITLLIEGQYAFGYLKAERGVHRLVRISPFDANKRRHTSFASVDVIPEIENDVDVEIQEKDLRIDVYRSSGPGGQSVNTTDSAVRITHLPSGIVVQCQNERSQYQNKQVALKILRARLYEFQRQKRDDKLAKEFASGKQKIEWGSQIRSYIMHPYNLVKDHRTGQQTGNVSSVMNGNIDEFIDAYLKKVTQG